MKTINISNGRQIHFFWVIEMGVSFFICYKTHDAVGIEKYFPRLFIFTLGIQSDVCRYSVQA